MSTDSGLGDRLREARKRSLLSQQELARASKISLSLIQKIEQGAVANTRLETLRKLAEAMRLPTSSLSGARGDREAPQPHTTMSLEPVRRALVGQIAQPGEEVTPDGVRAELDRLIPTFRNAQDSALIPVLPSLIRDADALDGVEGRRVRSSVLGMTGWFLTHTHQYAAAEMALGRALDNATDRSEASAVVNTQCWLLVRQGRITECIDLAVRWADQLEPRISRATDEELAAWGWMLIRVSMAAIRNNQPGEARDAIRLAQTAAVATTTGDERRFHGDVLRTFGQTMVALKRAELAMIEDKPDQVIALSERIPRAGVRPSSNNWNRHLLDLANANLRLRRPNDAFEIMRGIRASSPEWLVQQRYARDVTRTLFAKRRTLTSEMREFADFLGLDL
jgi:transcriptional regulator with XRE-family HTH domain